MVEQEFELKREKYMVDKKEENNTDENTQYNDYHEDMDIMESIQDTVHRTNPGLSAIYKKFLPIEEGSEEAVYPGFEDEAPEANEEKPSDSEAPKEQENSEKTAEKPQDSEETNDDEGGEEQKVLEALRSLKGGMEATYNFQNQMRQVLGQDWQPKALRILEEFGTDEDHEKFETVAYQAIPSKDEK
jgi:hypothetical protein